MVWKIYILMRKHGKFGEIKTISGKDLKILESIAGIWLIN
jgi:hypothetical protein